MEWNGIRRARVLISEQHIVLHLTDDIRFWFQTTKRKTKNKPNQNI